MEKVAALLAARGIGVNVWKATRASEFVERCVIEGLMIVFLLKRRGIRYFDIEDIELRLGDRYWLNMAG